jgi:predicted O-methyltransferase YrrM
MMHDLEKQKKIKKYIENLISNDNKQIEKLNKNYKKIKIKSELEPSMGKQAGKLLGLLIRTIKAKKALEFGTCLGYSTLWLAEAVKFTGGHIISIEFNEEFYNITKNNLQEAGLTKYVTLIHGDANKEIDKLRGPFDIIIQDSHKPLYPVMLERSIKLLRKNGLLIADDVLFKPMGMTPAFSVPIDKYNKRIISDKRLYSTILPIGDGIAVSVKI